MGSIFFRMGVNDIAGNDWNDRWNPDYSDHFQEVVLREKYGKCYGNLIRKFLMILMITIRNYI